MFIIIFLALIFLHSSPYIVPINHVHITTYIKILKIIKILKVIKNKTIVHKFLREDVHMKKKKYSFLSAQIVMIAKASVNVEFVNF